ncbi:hypothetical protein KFL_001770200 [Klebsormidium nitens]|uniref:Vacuolar protein sorting-associated protein 29 n=1 Tax=Klebsormidium nitens TaxID=105231 RepID=A0A1Y1HZQ1_KLENI|nr:hypothetical protein KFL_001770200 [Klebsormidium nitens]|eukprot:GAQ84134.1 hypothetical protein KFL_001770200 [Klebsormidium nitens]
MAQVVGLISDTHGVLLPEAVRALSAATGTIIHAGDIGEPRYKSRLKASDLVEELETGTGSKVVAVTGNVDDNCPETVALYPAFRTLRLFDRKFLVIHICGFPPAVDPRAADIIAAEHPDVVVFGHSHVPGAELHEGTLYINPGSAGPVRFRLPQCIAVLHFDGEYCVRFIRLGSSNNKLMALPINVKLLYDSKAGCFELDRPKIR